MELLWLVWGHMDSKLCLMSLCSSVVIRQVSRIPKAWGIYFKVFHLSGVSGPSYMKLNLLWLLYACNSKREFECHWSSECLSDWDALSILHTVLIFRCVIIGIFSTLYNSPERNNFDSSLLHKIRKLLEDHFIHYLIPITLTVISEWLVL